MTKLPNRLATPRSEIVTLKNNTILDAVKLKSTRVMINFQNADTSAFRPAKPYTMEPRMKGGMTRRGMMSNKSLARKYVMGE